MKSTFTMTLSAEEYQNLMEAAAFGLRHALGVKSGYVVRAWGETINGLKDRPLEDSRTSQERDHSYLANFAEDCRLNGCD